MSRAVRDHVQRMSEERPPEILGGLPNRRPQRRSEKRTAPAANGGAGSAPKQAGRAATKQPETATKQPKARARARTDPLRQPKQPAGTPPKPASRRPAPPSGPEIISTVVQAAAELVEIGVSASARAVREAVSRLPRP
jgi:hypothetical protein